MTATFLINDVAEIRSRGAVLIGVLAGGTLEIGMVSEALPLPQGARELVLRSIDYVDDNLSAQPDKLGLTFLESPSAAALKTALEGRAELHFRAPGQLGADAG